MTIDFRKTNRMLKTSIPLGVRYALVSLGEMASLVMLVLLGRSGV